MRSSRTVETFFMSADEELHGRDVEHARWRVSFLKSLLASHEAMPWKVSSWEAKAADYRTRIAEAEKELARLMGEKPDTA